MALPIEPDMDNNEVWCFMGLVSGIKFLLFGLGVCFCEVFCWFSWRLCHYILGAGADPALAGLPQLSLYSVASLKTHHMVTYFTSLTANSVNHFITYW